MADSGALLPVRVLVYSVVDRTIRGGAQVVIADLLSSLRQSGIVVTEAWGAAGPQRTPGEWVCPLWLRAPTGRTGGRRIHLPSLLRVLRGLVWFRPQVVNVHYISEQSYYFLLLKKALGYRVVLSAHGSDLLRPWPRDKVHLADFLGMADAITVVSEDLRLQVLGFPGVDPARVHVIANGVDCDFWKPADDPRPGTTHASTIVAVGRLEHVKGFDVLLAALARLRRSVPEARLCIIGDGESRDGLARQVHALGLGDAVEFAGSLNRDAIRERLQTADAFVLSSRSEGMPLALLEAMACGLPCVATRVGGVAETVEDSGVLVSADAPDEIAGALEQILGDRDFAARTGAAARDRALAFSSRRSVEAYEQLYRKLLA